MSVMLMVAVSTGGAWGMTAAGILCLFAAVAIFFLYKVKRKRKDQEERASFKETMSRRRMRYSMFSFWTNYTYIFLIAVGIIAGLILLGVGIGALV